MRHNRGRFRRGSVLPYVLFVLPLMVWISSMAVDWARVQLAKTELLHAADAAARAGAVQLNNGVTATQNAAVAMAANNTVAGSPLVLDPNNDIDFGTWNPSTRTFTVLTGAARSGANALRVNAKRTGSSGIPLTFGAVFNAGKCNATASATAVMSMGYGVVGLNSISMSGNSSDSYWSPTGYAGSASQHGSIASNGFITLSGNTSVQGDAHPGIGKSVIGASHVSGSTTPLTTALSYPNASAGSYAVSNDNAQEADIIAGDLTVNGNKNSWMPGGNYYVNNLSMGNNSDLWVLGPATIYVTGTININGNIHTPSNKPSNLTIKVCSSSSVAFYNNSAVYVNLYAPQSAVTLGGSGDVYGQVIGLTVSMTGSSAIHYDLALPGAYGISSVK